MQCTGSLFSDCYHWVIIVFSLRILPDNCLDCVASTTRCLCMCFCIFLHANAGRAHLQPKHMCIYSWTFRRK